jgi:hypothetical protein
MAVSPYGNYEYLTKMAEKTHTGVPASVFYDMQEDDLEFDGAMEAFAARHQAQQDEAFGVDEMLAEGDSVDYWGSPVGEGFDPEQDIDDFFDFYGDDLLEQVIDQEKQYNDVYSFLAGSGMDSDAASAQADASVRDIPIDEVTLLESEYPGIVPYYEVDANEWNELEETSESLLSQVGDVVGEAFDALGSFIFEDVIPASPVSAAGFGPTDTETEDDSWWENFVDTVSGYVEPGLEAKPVRMAGEGAFVEAKGVGDFIKDKMENIDDFLSDIGITELERYESLGKVSPGTARKSVVWGELNGTLKDAASPAHAIVDIVEALDARVIDMQDVREWTQSQSFTRALEDAGFDMDEFGKALWDGVEGSQRFFIDTMGGPGMSDLTGFRTAPATIDELTSADWFPEDEPVPDEVKYWLGGGDIQDVPSIPDDVAALLSGQANVAPETTIEKEIRKTFGLPVPITRKTTTTGYPTAAAATPTTPDDAVDTEAAGTVDAATGQTKEDTPNLWYQFLNLFNGLQGSQTMQAQNFAQTAYNQALNVYYATIGWKEHDWYKPTSPSKELSKTDQGKEEGMFRNWLNTTFFPNTKEARFGEKFYDGVRRIRDNLVEMEGWGEAASVRLKALKEQGKDEHQYMMDQLFFEEDSNRLATIVGMYNIYPGMAPSTQNKVMAFYKNIMAGWLASPNPQTGMNRTSAQFAQTFIGERPMMAPRDQGKTASVETIEGI